MVKQNGIVFEYRLVRTDSLKDLFGHKMEERLNALGAQGFQLVWVDRLPRMSVNLGVNANVHSETIVYMVRERKKEAKV